MWEGVQMLDHAQIDQLQQHDPDHGPGCTASIDDLTEAEIKQHVRRCEHWYAQHQASFAEFKGQYLAISFKSWLSDNQVEMRNIVISPSSLEVTRQFEQRFGTNGGYERRIGDPLFDF
jgi:hypothetical protein